MPDERETYRRDFKAVEPLGIYAIAALSLASLIGMIEVIYLYAILMLRR
jgi:hypothetical protein